MQGNRFSEWPSYSQEEVEAVTKVLHSNKVNYWTGQEGRLFEKEFAEFSDCKYAIAVANGSLGLELALKAINVNEGDEVIVTPRTFIASASSIVNCGATPIFADVDPNSQNITADTIKEVISEKTKAVICVHLAGMPCEMDAIMELADSYGLYVIEDCAQAHGAMYKGRSVGSIGHIGAWSFCQDKIMTTGGEGGMVTTNDDDLWGKMWSYKDHGKSWATVYEKEHPPGFRWLHESFGSNYRLTEMQSAIGRIQLKKMPDWHIKRVQNAKLLNAAVANIDLIRVLAVPKYIQHAYYKHYMFIRPEKLKSGWTRDRIIEDILSKGVPVLHGSCSEVYLEKAFTDLKLQPIDRCDEAKKLGDTSLMFLVHPTLSETEIKKVCEVISHVFMKATL